MKAVFFDLVETLIRPTAPIGLQYAGVAREHGVSADAEALEAAFRRAMAVAPGLQLDPASLEQTVALERRWWKDLVHGVVMSCGLEALADPVLFDRYFASLYEHFTTAAAWELYEDVVPALEALAAAGLIVGLITNYDTRVFPVLDAVGLSGRLDSVTIPATAGFSKPDPRIFARALDQHGLEPPEAMYVGDSLGDDYRGSEAAGLVPVLLDRAGRHAGLPGVRRIGRLTETHGLV